MAADLDVTLIPYEREEGMDRMIRAMEDQAGAVCRRLYQIGGRIRGRGSA